MPQCDSIQVSRLRAVVSGQLRLSVSFCCQAMAIVPTSECDRELNIKHENNLHQSRGVLTWLDEANCVSKAASQLVRSAGWR